MENKLARALELDLPYSERFPIAKHAKAAVLALFGSARDGELSLLVIKRSVGVSEDRHSGQMAFPGGKCDEDELASGDIARTALRETFEEVGIPASQVRLLGHLPALVTGTGFEVTPFVGWLEAPIEDVPLKLDDREVAGAFWVNWEVLSNPSTYQREMFERGPIRFPTHVYTVDGNRIWGATGAMIKNLLDRLAIIG